LSLLTITVLNLIYIYTNIISSNKKVKLFDENDTTKKTECQLEWEKLNEHAYVRRPTVYHFTDLNELRLTIFRHPEFKMYKYILIVTVSIISQETIVEYIIDKLIVNEAWNSGREAIKAPFNLMTRINNSTNFKIKMKVCMEKMQNCTKNPLDVIVRKLVPLEIEREQFQNSAICTDAYSFKKDRIQALEWWFKINQLNGYNKIVITNHSMGNGNDEFEQLFLKNNKFVKLNQLQCYPNFYGNQSQIIERPFVRLNELKKLYNKNVWAYTFQNYVFNECYTANRINYKYITITDQDESIAPRGLLNSTIDLFHSDSHDYRKLITDYQCYNNSKLEIYLNNLLQNLKIDNKMASFHFKMSIHLKNKTVDLIFKQLGLFLNNLNETQPIDYKVLIQDDNEINSHGAKLKFWFAIRNQTELDYAKRIYKFHTELIEPILRKNKQLLDKVAAESFNRVYILFGQNSTGFLWGKTIHNTITTDSMTTHFGGKSVNIPIEYGHLSHFREIYNIHWGIYPIKELMFDFNYYNCYFKPIIKKFGLHFKEF
jgi:hypothetical protein